MSNVLAIILLASSSIPPAANAGQMVVVQTRATIVRPFRMTGDPMRPGKGVPSPDMPRLQWQTSRDPLIAGVAIFE
jgi:hypothetical protein